MNILFVIQASHWKVGGHALVRRYASFAHAADFQTSVMVVPYFDRPGESSYHWFTRAKIAKKTYDHCFVIESAPPEEWLEAFDSIYWVPMVEFVKRSHVENLHPSIKILWHSRAGFDATTGFPNKSIRTPYVGPKDTEGTTDIKTKNGNKVIVHQRARCLDVNLFMETLLSRSSKAEVILWNHVGRRDSLDHWEGPRVQLHKGWMEKKEWDRICMEASVYIAGRAMEGIGLCVQEAAMRGCVIAGPRQTVSGEYINGEGAILVDLFERPQEDWLTKRYDWSASPGEMEEATVRLAHKVADYIDFTPAGEKTHRSALATAEIMKTHDLCEMQMRNLFSSLGRRKFDILPRTRRRILSIQTCTWGGQGLFELWTLRYLSKHPHHSVFSSRLWIQKNDAEEQTEYARLMDGQDIRMVAPHLSDLNSVDPNYVIFHWSGGAQALCDEDQLRNVETFLFSTEATVIVWVHNVQPVHFPDWLLNRADMIVFPSEHARKAHSSLLESKRGSCTPSGVIPHFLDPEVAEKPLSRKHGSMTLGILGRVQWSKFDPAYYRAIRDFLDSAPGSQVLWVGSSSDGYLEGDEYTARTIDPEIISSFGPARVDLLDRITVGLFLSPIQESFCLAALEMASRGTPVVTNRPEIKELLGEAAMMVASPQDLKLALNRLCLNGPVFSKMQKGGIALRGDERFTYETWEKNFFDMISRTGKQSTFGKWSVIVPCHNVSPWITQCLESIVANDPDEIIVVVDGCTDDTYEKVKAFIRKHKGSSRIRVRVNPDPPHSQGHSWKLGLECANNNLIALVDGDDMMADRALARMKKEHMENGHACLIWSDQCVLNTAGEVVQACFSSPPLKGKTILEGMKRGINVVSHLITFKAWAVPFLTFPDDLTCSADKHLALQLEELGPWAFVEEELYVYRWMRPGSVTATRHEEQKEMRERVIQMAESRREGPKSLRYNSP